MAKGRALAIVLDDVERGELTALTRKHGAPQALAERARIVLAAASGLNNKEIAVKVGVCATTAGTWRNRFAKSRMDGLYDEPRPGAPREIGDEEIASTIRKTLETLPKGATHWSLRSMAREIGHAPSTVHRIWRAFGLQPHRSHPSAPLCSVSTRNPRCRRSTARNRCCQCGPAKSNGARMIAKGMEQQPCLQHLMRGPEPSSENAWPATVRRNSANSSMRSSAMCLLTSTSTSSWTTTAHTRPS
jgi:transposase